MVKPFFTMFLDVSRFFVLLKRYESFQKNEKSRNIQKHREMKEIHAMPKMHMSSSGLSGERTSNFLAAKKLEVLSPLKVQRSFVACYGISAPLVLVDWILGIQFAFLIGFVPFANRQDGHLADKINVCNVCNLE